MLWYEGPRGDRGEQIEIRLVGLPAPEPAQGIDEVKGARFTRCEDGIEIDPEAPAWTAWWMA